LKVNRANRKQRNLQLFAPLWILAATVGFGIESSGAQQLAVRADQRPPQDAPAKPAAKPRVAVATAAPGESVTVPAVKPVRRSAVRGPYYVDFRARTAASYGHAFVWFGKTSERKVDVAGLHPAGDTLPYILGHLTFVPSETGASYGDLDEQYLTANYRVYLSEADAKKVFAHIRHLQATSPVWNAETTNCTAFIGRIASFMGLKTPFHLLKPEEYVNQLKGLNGGRQTVQLSADNPS
jgi:hypothetical protein